MIKSIVLHKDGLKTMIWGVNYMKFGSSGCKMTFEEHKSKVECKDHEHVWHKVDKF